MITISNEYLTIKINELGAELVSVIDNKSGYEYMWQGDKRYWAGTAPVLFPIVGSLKEGKYHYEDKEYEMAQHGFARRLPFTTQAVTDTSATFYLKNSEETWNQYPFEFSFQITYILFENKVSISYEVLNPSGDKDLYYSVGGHPGFNVSHHRPLKGQPEFQNVSFTFEPSGSYYQIPIVEGRSDLNRGKFVPVDNNPILHKSFKRDALIFRLANDTKAILHDQNNHVKITLSPSNFELMGIWSSYPKKAGFVCLEPWSGLTDPSDATGNLTEKYGINKLEPESIKTHDYTLTFDKYQ